MTRTFTTVNDMRAWLRDHADAYTRAVRFPDHLLDEVVRDVAATVWRGGLDNEEALDLLVAAIDNAAEQYSIGVVVE